MAAQDVKENIRWLTSLQRHRVHCRLDEIFNYFTRNCFWLKKSMRRNNQRLPHNLILHAILFNCSNVLFPKQYFTAVSFRLEIKSDWSERFVFGRKFVLYDDLSRDNCRTLMGRTMFDGQHWDSRWPVMGQGPVWGRNRIMSSVLVIYRFSKMVATQQTIYSRTFLERIHLS